MEHELDRCFFVIHRFRHAFLRERFSGLDLEIRLLPLIMLLSRREGIRQEDLSAHTGLDKTTVAHAVKRLVQLGYVSRERNPEDRRCYQLTLTTRGKDLVPQVRNAMQDWHAGVLAPFSEEEREMLEGLLSRMAEGAGAMVGRSRDTYGPSGC